MNASDKHRISLFVSKLDYTSFERLYPHCLSSFLRNCIEYANKDKDFFQNIYFRDLDESLQKYCINKMLNRLDGVLE